MYSRGQAPLRENLFRKTLVAAKLLLAAQTRVPEAR